jgi:pimeloyl-ACP methyl ester carboxylesterase
MSAESQRSPRPLEPGERSLRPPHGGEYDIEVRPAETPSGAPPVVFVPGVGGPRGTFHHQIAAFARDRDVVAMNLNPEVARGMDAIDSATHDVLHTLDALGLGRVDLIGASYGACIVARFGWRFPERVRRMVWIVPPVVRSRKWRGAFGPGWLFGGAALKYSPVRHRRLVAQRVAGLRIYDPEPDLGADELERIAARASDTNIRPFFRRFFALRAWDWAALPAPHPVPAIVIQGRVEHEASPLEAIRAWERLTGRPISVLPGRHMPYLSYPQHFNPIVLDFLARA